MGLPARLLLAAVVAAALAGCQSYSPKQLRVGDPESTGVALMGPPTARHAMPGGITRLVYARGPMGKHTYMVDLGPDGGVTQWKQVLGELEFADIRPGWTTDEVLREFGPPASRQPNRPIDGQLWAYRYENFECRWFLVDIGPDHKVVGTALGTDPMCDSPM
jgi:hypothetical protein